MYEYTPKCIRDAFQIDAYLKKDNDIACIALCEAEVLIYSTIFVAPSKHNLIQNPLINSTCRTNRQAVSYRKRSSSQTHENLRRALRLLRIAIHFQ
jgi:hypothetical protein